MKKRMVKTIRFLHIRIDSENWLWYNFKHAKAH